MLNVANHMVKDVVNAGRADLYLLNRSSEDTAALIWHDPDKALTANLSKAPDLELPIRGLIGSVASGQGDGKAGEVVSNRVSEDPRYDKEIDNRSHWAQPVSMLCVPIMLTSRDQEVFDTRNCLGVLQHVNKIDIGGFSEYDSHIAIQVRW